MAKPPAGVGTSFLKNNTQILFFSQKVGELSLLILAMFFIGGIQLFCTGIVGQYLAKVYVETKKRPIYIIKEEI